MLKCVICFEEEGPFVDPGCGCTGDGAVVHESCLRSFGRSHCTLCARPFVVHISRYDRMIAAARGAVSGILWMLLLIVIWTLASMSLVPCVNVLMKPMESFYVCALSAYSSITIVWGTGLLYYLFCRQGLGTLPPEYRNVFGIALLVGAGSVLVLISMIWDICRKAGRTYDAVLTSRASFGKSIKMT